MVAREVAGDLLAVARCLRRPPSALQAALGLHGGDHLGPPERTPHAALVDAQAAGNRVVRGYGIRGVYHSVSRKHLQSYLDEYAFRYNHRDDPAPMFKILLGNVRRLAA